MNSIFSRRSFIQTSVFTGAALAARRVIAAVPQAKSDFPRIDYHVHLSQDLPIDKVVALSRERKVQMGIVEHPGQDKKIQTDADLKQYIDSLRNYPVLIGLQPIVTGWSKAFSASLLHQLDYVLMDALVLPNRERGVTLLWEVDTFVEDDEEFMSRYMQYIELVLGTEPIDVFAWPTFLPFPLARQYAQLWTRPRVQRIIDLAKARKIAIEINELARVPDDNFIALAKRAGLKFTIGTDSRNQNAGQLHYSLQMAQRCGLTADDVFVPRNKRELAS